MGKQKRKNSQDNSQAGKTGTGPKPEVLKINMDWEDAVRDVLKVNGKPVKSKKAKRRR